MDTLRPTKTFADYVVIAISPVLIIVMVHSVCFFLVEVFYRSEAAGGVRWVLFWFVLASVLIARIGIEQGDGQALVYSLALAAVTWLYLTFIQTNPVFGALLLGIVWFIAHKITTNCTLIDEDEDASGQGLLQSARRLQQRFRKTGPPPLPSAPPSLPQPGVPRGFGARPPAPPKPPAKKKRRAQTPGITLIYFSLAALPIFGLGQMLLPTGDAAAHHKAFVYLFSYLASALGLFVTTSFLGLRRYLRQRYVDMPGNIARGWIETGVVVTLIVLVLALMLPRPGAGQAWAALRYHVDYQLHRASDFAARFNPHGKGSGRQGDQTSHDNGQDDKSTADPRQNPNPDNNANSKGQGEQHSTGPDGGQGGDQPQSGGNQQGDQGGPNGQHGNKPARQSPAANSSPDQNGPGGASVKPAPNVPQPSSSLFSWLRILFWLAVILGLAWLCYRYRATILAAWQQLLAAIRAFIAMLLGVFNPSSAVGPAVAKKTQVPPFKTFKDPFLTGGANVWAPEKLITYSYNALQSWALEQEAAKGSPQTPRELCRQLGTEIPEASDALEHLAFLYGHVAYGGSVPGHYNPEQLRAVWNLMFNPRPARAEASVSETEPAGKI